MARPVNGRGSGLAATAAARHEGEAAPQGLLHRWQEPEGLAAGRV